jgi:hypothetical protein
MIGNYVSYYYYNIKKIDANGNDQWTNSFPKNTPIYSVQQTSDGGYIGVGSSLISKKNATGIEEWTKTFAGTVCSIHQTLDGGYIISGYTSSRSPSGVFLSKIDATGNIQWLKSSYGGGSALFVQPTSDSGYIIAGQIGKDARVIKTDTKGDERWNKTFRGTFTGTIKAYHVWQTSDRGYLIAVRTEKTAKMVDAGIIKTDVNGNEQWNKTCGETEKEHYVDIKLTSDGDYVCVGWVEPSLEHGDRDLLLKKIRGGKTIGAISIETPTGGSIKTPTASSVETSTVDLPTAPPTGTQAEIPIESPTEKTSGFEIVLSITALSILYVFWRKRR